MLPGIEPDGKLVWTYFEAVVPKAIPKSLVVMGSGAIGMSSRLPHGSEVTVVELLPQILPVEDADIASVARKHFEKQGIKIFTGAPSIPFAGSISRRSLLLAPAPARRRLGL